MIFSLKRSFLNKFRSPASKLILATANHNRKLLILTFNANLLSSVLETGTFAVIYLALGVLTNDVVLSGVNNPIVANSIVLGFLESLNHNQLFICLVLLAIFIQILRSFLTYVGAIGAGNLSIRMTEQMELRLFDLVISFSFPCASRYKIGDLLSYINSGGIVQRQIQLWNELIISFFMVIAYSAVILWISPQLSIFAVILSFLLLKLQRYLEPIFKQLSLDTTHISVELSKEKTESIQALRLIHTFGQQRFTRHKIYSLYNKLIPLRQSEVRVSAISNPISNILIILTIGGLLIGGFIILSTSPKILVPSLITFISAFNRLAVQVQSFLNYLNQSASYTGQMKRLNEILETQDKEFTKVGGIQFTNLNQVISFQEVWLEYQPDQEPALKHLSFEIPKGKVIALVGSSGAGKSSIADLLVGLYEPTKGSIQVDGVDLREYNYESWRSRLGVVSQDTFIFNTSILENIRYGMPDVNEEQVIEAAKQAQAHQFIIDLPLGYETLVGERGYRLSGGQRQRVALARAILRQPEILILDEATSALDSQSERLVQEALGKFQSDSRSETLGERTALVIAHRLSTIVNADEIIVLEKGSVVERGNHRELLDLDGWYADYWQLQSKGSELVA